MIRRRLLAHRGSPIVQLALGAILASCGCERSDGDSGVDAPWQIESRLSGCDEVREGFGCVPPEDGSLRWWVQVPAQSTPTVVVDGETLAMTDHAVGAAHRYHFRVPKGGGSLELRMTQGPRVWRETWRLARSAPCSVVDAMRAARQGGTLEQVEELAQPVRAAAGDPCHAAVLGELARAHLAEGRRDEALQGLRAAKEAQRRAGCVSCEARDAFALSYALTFEARRFHEAREVLDGLEPRLNGAADAWAQVSQYRGILLFEAGDLRGALSSLQEADARADSLGLAEQRHAVALSIALSLQRLGRAPEAVERLRAIRKELTAQSSPCVRAALHNNLAWAGLAVAEGEKGASRRKAIEEVIDGFEQALRAYRDGCDRASQVRNVLVNLAYARERVGDNLGAHRALDEAHKAGAGKGPRTKPWLSIIAANLALEEGRSRQAMTLFQQGREEAEDSLQDAAAWQAQLGIGRALETSGESLAAIEAYRRAEAMLDAQVPWIPLVEGLDTFLASREDGARALVDLLLRLNRPEEALQAARVARVRALWSLRWVQQIEALEPSRRRAWERAIAAYHHDRATFEEELSNDWQLSESSLRRVQASRRDKRRALGESLERSLALLHAGTDRSSPLALLQPGPGEVVWTAHPAGDGWACFAKDSEGIAVARIPALPEGADAQTLADAMLQPFEAMLDRARRIRVLGYGPVRELDLHALPWHGVPLVASKSVAYSADLAVPTNDGSDGDERSMLLVADPRRDLPSARLEADAVTRTLPKAFRERLRRMDGRQATRVAVVAEMREAGWFHYAGHGEFAGHGGWDSSLPFADGRLTVGDILALPRVPSLVVLSGCETGRISDRSPLSQVGLAQAFTIAGSRTVVAATRPVSDVLASQLSAALYAAWNKDADAVDALARAQRALLASSPEQDWAAFRAFLP